MPDEATDTGSPLLVLASASPRRRDLLARAGLAPDRIVPPDIDEAERPGERPRDLARRLAEAKAARIAADFPDSFVLGADTVVACGRRILPKAETEAEVRACLKLLSGRRHQVIGGIAACAPGGRTVSRLVVTQVVFKRLEPGDVDAYVATGEWHGKAGGYAIQGRAEAFVRRINGSYSNVVGLALLETLALLKGLGYRAPAVP